MTVKEIEKRLLRLDTRSRGRLAERLLHSLDELSDVENERLWAEEALRRHRQLSGGKAKSRTAADVLRGARARLR